LFSYIGGAYSNSPRVFLPIKVAYSITHSLSKGYDVELGIRYLGLSYKKSTDTNTTNSYMVGPTAAISKEIKDFYLSLRGYQLNFNNDGKKVTYYSFIFTSRYYLTDNRSEFFTAIAGYGTAPDDFSTNAYLDTNARYKSIIVGAGYRKQVHYRTTFGINVSWYNQQIKQDLFKNQYDVYFTLLRKF